MSGLSSLGFFLILIAAGLTAAANLLLRKGIELGGGFAAQSFITVFTSFLKLLLQPFFLIGFILYFGAALFWFRVIASEPLYIAYPLLVSFSFILVTMGTALFLQEPISWRVMLGIAIIIFGIVLISKGSRI